MKFSGGNKLFYSDYSETPFNGASIMKIGGQHCYYKIIDNEIQVEFYDHLAKKFKIWYGEIHPDKIHFYKYRLRVWGGAKGKLNFVFNKQSVSFKINSLQPD